MRGHGIGHAPVEHPADSQPPVVFLAVAGEECPLALVRAASAAPRPWLAKWRSAARSMLSSPLPRALSLAILSGATPPDTPGRPGRAATKRMVIVKGSPAGATLAGMLSAERLSLRDVLWLPKPCRRPRSSLGRPLASALREAGTVQACHLVPRSSCRRRLSLTARTRAGARYHRAAPKAVLKT
jgi:hypothetical protein